METPLLGNQRSTNGGHEGEAVSKRTAIHGLLREFGSESKRLWRIAGPAIFTAITQYSLGALTQTFAGHVDELALAAFSVENSVIAGLAFGVMLFAYALNFPIQKFLQAQRKVMVMAVISLIVLVIHTIFSWFLMLKLGWGLVGGAVMLNTSWWLIVILQVLYIFITTSDGAWTGFSWLAFADLWAFVKLSLASAVMLCLEFWYLMILIVITGHLTDPLIPVDAISVCDAVAAETTKLALLLGLTVLLNSLQPGIWGGMIGGICLQTFILILITWYTNWNKEAEQAESRVKRWGGAIAEGE
ncbi:hypothetical protein SAY86_011664 [Trapa natans]|uniref:Uncharacterized protein n=1 Tax=Trapa natans TaxID=22666 RepID=A0AAN7R5B5_TRANT|nr:hypothetical protein SAY86_011664 [Trapa natans]